MSARNFGCRPALSGGTESLTTLIKKIYSGFTDTTFAVLTVRAGKTNAGTAYFSGSDGDGNTKAFGFIDAGESLSLDLTTLVHTDNVFVKGTALDTIYIWGIEY